MDLSILLERWFKMARKSRKQQYVDWYDSKKMYPGKMEKDKKYNVAIYARLSNESEINRECETIQTQIAFVKDYVLKNSDMVIVDIYADISVSGTHFNRPQFQRMMEDAKDGKIDTIVTKDLSRLGRNYLETAIYIEEEFPVLGIRYISILDSFDTIKNSDEISVPLKNIINESYSRDLSRKVISAQQALWEKGEFIAPYPPYGYHKKNKHLYIDENVCENVKFIFDAFFSGMGYSAIANELNLRKIVSPKIYLNYKGGKTDKNSKEWRWQYVKKILSDEYYIGNSVHVRKNKSRFLKNSPERFVRIVNTHEPIIDKDLFYKVQDKMQHKTDEIKKKWRNNIPPNIFLKKIFCGKCRRLMTRYITTSRNCYYICKSRECKKANENKSISISAADAEKAVLKSIRIYSKEVIDKIDLKQQNKSKKEVAMLYQFFEREIQHIKNKLYECDSRNIELYEKYKEHRITVEELYEKKEKCSDEKHKLQVKINELIKYQEKYSNDSCLDDKGRKLLEMCSKKRVLTQKMVDLFVDKVIIYDKDNIDVSFSIENFENLSFLNREGL